MITLQLLKILKKIHSGNKIMQKLEKYMKNNEGAETEYQQLASQTGVIRSSKAL